MYVQLMSSVQGDASEIFWLFLFTNIRTFTDNFKQFLSLSGIQCFYTLLNFFGSKKCFSLQQKYNWSYMNPPQLPQSKSMDWFLYDRDLRHESVKSNKIWQMKRKEHV